MKRILLLLIILMQFLNVSAQEKRKLLPSVTEKEFSVGFNKPISIEPLLKLVYEINFRNLPLSDTSVVFSNEERLGGKFTKNSDGDFVFTMERDPIEGYGYYISSTLSDSENIRNLGGALLVAEVAFIPSEPEYTGFTASFFDGSINADSTLIERSGYINIMHQDNISTLFSFSIDDVYGQFIFKSIKIYSHLTPNLSEVTGDIIISNEDRKASAYSNSIVIGNNTLGVLGERTIDIPEAKGISIGYNVSQTQPYGTFIGERIAETRNNFVGIGIGRQLLINTDAQDSLMLGYGSSNSVYLIGQDIAYSKKNPTVIPSLSQVIAIGTDIMGGIGTDITTSIFAGFSIGRNISSPSTNNIVLGNSALNLRTDIKTNSNVSSNVILGNNIGNNFAPNSKVMFNNNFVAGGGIFSNSRDTVAMGNFVYSPADAPSLSRVSHATYNVIIGRWNGNNSESVNGSVIIGTGNGGNNFGGTYTTISNDVIIGNGNLPYFQKGSSNSNVIIGVNNGINIKNTSGNSSLRNILIGYQVDIPSNTPNYSRSNYINIGNAWYGTASSSHDNGKAWVGSQGLTFNDPEVEGICYRIIYNTQSETLQVQKRTTLNGSWVTVTDF